MAAKEAALPRAAFKTIFFMVVLPFLLVALGLAVAVMLSQDRFPFYLLRGQAFFLLAIVVLLIRLDLFLAGYARRRLGIHLRFLTAEGPR